MSAELCSFERLTELLGLWLHNSDLFFCHHISLIFLLSLKRTLVITWIHPDNPGKSPVSRSLTKSHLPSPFSHVGYHRHRSRAGVRTWTSLHLPQRPSTDSAFSAMSSLTPFQQGHCGRNIKTSLEGGRPFASLGALSEGHLSPSLVTARW